MDRVKALLRDLIDVAISLIALGVAVNVVFGPDAAFVPNVIGNINNIVAFLGSEQLVGLITLLIIVTVLRRNA